MESNTDDIGQVSRFEQRLLNDVVIDLCSSSKNEEEKDGEEEE